MNLTDERIKEFQEIFKKEYGKELSWEEASESAYNLVGFFKLLMDIEIKDKIRQDKLKENPKGFHVTDGQYTCPICGCHISGDQTWYDKHGLKCLDCQKAVNKKIIPGSVFKNKDSWYSVWEFDYYFKIKSPTVRKFVRQGKLKSRVIPGIQGGKHSEIFLIKDNIGVLPEKPEGYLVKDEKDMIHVEYKSVKLPDFMVVPGKNKLAVTAKDNSKNEEESIL